MKKIINGIKTNKNMDFHGFEIGTVFRPKFQTQYCWVYFLFLGCLFSVVYAISSTIWSTYDGTSYANCNFNKYKISHIFIVEKKYK